MGSVNRNWTENQAPMGGSVATWYSTLTLPNLTITHNEGDDESTKKYKLSNPSLVARFVDGNKNRCALSTFNTRFQTDTGKYLGYTYFERGSGGSESSGTNYTIPITQYNNLSKEYSVSNLFNEDSKTSRTLTVKAYVTSIYSSTYNMNWSYNPPSVNYMSYYQQSWSNPGSLMGDIATITLDAPPTFDAAEVTFNTPIPYAGKTTATVSVSNLHARYGGDIASATLTIGDQVSTSRTTDGDLTIDLNAVGSFDPVVTVTDSRGQTTTIQLSTIYVYAYICNVSMVTVERIDASTNKLADEGTNAMLKASFNYSDYTGSNLIAPVVKVNDTVTSNVTWYTSWNNTSGFSGQVSDWSTIMVGQTLYGKISDNFSINTSYTIDLYPQTTVQAASSESYVSVTLAQAFYLIAGKAGGHGLGIGKKPSENDFEVAMVANFEDQVYVLDELKVYDDATFREDIILDLVDYDLSGTTDYDIYEAICDLDWDSDVLIDDTIIHI